MAERRRGTAATVVITMTITTPPGGPQGIRMWPVQPDLAFPRRRKVSAGRMRDVEDR